jgi:hypothetical protein
MITEYEKRREKKREERRKREMELQLESAEDQAISRLKDKELDALKIEIGGGRMNKDAPKLTRVRDEPVLSSVETYADETAKESTEGPCAVDNGAELDGLGDKPDNEWAMEFSKSKKSKKNKKKNKAAATEIIEETEALQEMTQPESTEPQDITHLEDTENEKVEMPGESMKPRKMEKGKLKKKKKSQSMSFDEFFEQDDTTISHPSTIIPSQGEVRVDNALNVKDLLLSWTTLTVNELS